MMMNLFLFDFGWNFIDCCLGRTINGEKCSAFLKLCILNWWLNDVRLEFFCGELEIPIFFTSVIPDFRESHTNHHQNIEVFFEIYYSNVFRDRISNFSNPVSSYQYSIVTSCWTDIIYGYRQHFLHKARSHKWEKIPV